MILIFNVDTSLAEGRSGAAGAGGPIHCDLRDDDNVDIDNARWLAEMVLLSLQTTTT